MRNIRPIHAAALLALVAASGCATLQQFAALRSVDFSLDGVADVRLAGIDLERIRSYEDLSVLDVGRLALAVRQGSLPLQLQVRVLAENPVGNPSARLTRMDWTLLLQDRETLSGALTEETVLLSGEPRVVPIDVSLNLIDFFEGNARDLVELALSLAGQGGAPKQIAVRASPVISTPLGPIRYPQPITIVDRQVGGDR